jgi:hypothetical protein
MAEQHGNEYAAGLWKRDIEYQLLWRTLSLTRRCRPTIYRPPSWSWASVEGEVMIGYGYGPEPRVSPPLEAKVLDIEVENLGDDSPSEVIRASLRVQCAPLVQATAAVTGIGNTYSPSIILSGNSIDGLLKSIETRKTCRIRSI